LLYWSNPTDPKICPDPKLFLCVCGNKKEKSGKKIEKNKNIGKITILVLDYCLLNRISISNIFFFNYHYYFYTNFTFKLKWVLFFTFVQPYKHKQKKKKKSDRPILFSNPLLLQYNNLFFLALLNRDLFKVMCSLYANSAGKYNQHTLH